MKNSRKMRGLLVMLIAFAFCFLAEPVKADDRTALDGIYCRRHFRRRYDRRADHTGSKRQN